MEQQRLPIQELVEKAREWLANAQYAQSTCRYFKSVTNQLLQYAQQQNIQYFDTDVGTGFLKEHYGILLEYPLSEKALPPIRCMQKLAEIQMTGTVMTRGRKRRFYQFPACFKEIAESFIQERQRIGIIATSIQVSQLYLERYFNYLTGQNIDRITDISVADIHGFTKSLLGFSKQTRAAMLRTVRFFMKHCYEHHYHPYDLSEQVPRIHYDKSSTIPSSYSKQEVERILASVDRGSPLGKRDYAILLLLMRLGIRSGDIQNLKFENLDWENEKIRFVQHKTKNPVSLPLLEDVGQAIIDYLKYGRPVCDASNVFVRHQPPICAFSPRNMYALVHRYMLKSGINIEKRKSGPHALRHSLASRLLENKMPLPIISEILGHADSNTTMIYLKIDIEQLRQCALEVVR